METIFTYAERALSRHIGPKEIFIPGNLAIIYLWMDCSSGQSLEHNEVVHVESTRVTIYGAPIPIRIFHLKGPSGKYQKQLDWIRDHLPLAVQCELFSEIFICLVGTIPTDWLRMLKTFLV